MTKQFKQTGLQVARGVLNAQCCELLSREFRMIKDHYLTSRGLDTNKMPKEGDGPVENSFGYYSAFCFESLLSMIQPEVEKIVDKKLYPVYSYARIMHKGAELQRHTDAGLCEYLATVCIYEDPNTPYPIYCEDHSKNAHEAMLHTGDMLVFEADKLDHWREKYTGAEHIQAFLLYVNADGECANLKYDRRKALGLRKPNELTRSY